MDQVYSLTLLLALISGGLGVASGLGLLLYARRQDVVADLSRRFQRLRRLVQGAGLLALLFAVTSLAVHAIFGHGPGTAEAMGPVSFIQIHPVYIGAFGLIGVVFLLLRLRVQGSSNGTT